MRKPEQLHKIKSFKGFWAQILALALHLPQNYSQYLNASGYFMKCWGLSPPPARAILRKWWRSRWIAHSLWTWMPGFFFRIMCSAIVPRKGVKYRRVKSSALGGYVEGWRKAAFSAQGYRHPYLFRISEFLSLQSRQLLLLTLSCPILTSIPGWETLPCFCPVGIITTCGMGLLLPKAVSTLAFLFSKLNIALLFLCSSNYNTHLLSIKKKWQLTF